MGCLMSHFDAHKGLPCACFGGLALLASLIGTLVSCRRPCAGAAPLPSNDGKKWSQEEVTELLLLVEDEGYRRQRLGLEKVRGVAEGTLHYDDATVAATILP